MIIQQKQPKGFPIFFLTEMWERYGFYVIQTLLIFYLTDNLHLDDKSAYVTVGSFTALAYINSVFGGAIADKFIGSSKGVLIGGLLLSIGYCLLSIHINTFFLNLALAVITVGTGLLKPNASSLLSILYSHKDSRKDAGYTLYYVGIYAGAISGSLLGGYLQKTFGWSIAFYSASLGGIISVLTFAFGICKFKLVDKRKAHPTAKDYLATLVSIVALIITSYFVLHSEFLSLIYFIIIAIFCLSFLLYCIAKHHGAQKNRLIAFLILMIISVGYWGIYFQQFFSISLCIARVGNSSAPASIFSAIESFGVIIFGPLINLAWNYWQFKGKKVSIPTKFSFGFLFNAFGFLIIAIGLWYANIHSTYLNTFVIVASYLIIAIGELSLSPTSLSMVTSLVPENLSSIMMGISLLSIGFGGKVAGLLANDAIINTIKTSLNDTKNIYMHSFLTYFVISLIIFIITICLTKYLRKLISL